MNILKMLVLTAVLVLVAVPAIPLEARGPQGPVTGGQASGKDLNGEYVASGTRHGDGIPVTIKMTSETAGSITNGKTGTTTSVTVTSIDGPIIYFYTDAVSMCIFNTETGEGQWYSPWTGNSGFIRKVK